MTYPERTGVTGNSGLRHGLRFYSFPVMGSISSPAIRAGAACVAAVKPCGSESRKTGWKKRVPTFAFFGFGSSDGWGLDFRSRGWWKGRGGSRWRYGGGWGDSS